MVLIFLAVSEIALGFESRRVPVFPGSFRRYCGVLHGIFFLGFADKEFPFGDSFLFLLCLVFLVKKHAYGPCFAFGTRWVVFCTKCLEVKNDYEFRYAALGIRKGVLRELNSRRKARNSLEQRRNSDFPMCARKISKSRTTENLATPLR